MFDRRGRHLRTVHALTGTDLLRFRYDDSGRLDEIENGDGLITKVERDATGAPVRIIAPFGQETVPTLDANGYLASVTNPADETGNFAYDGLGRLTSWSDALQAETTAEYDTLGRLRLETDPEGGFKQLNRRSVDPRTTEVTLTTAEGRTTRYETRRDQFSTRRTITGSDGLPRTQTSFANGLLTMVRPDGTQVAAAITSDPLFGMQAPYVSSLTIQTPSGLAAEYRQRREAELLVPNDPLSLVSSSRTLEVNGREYTLEYDATERRYVVTSPQGRQAFGTVDQQGRWLAVATAGLEPTRFAYDLDGRLSTIRRGTGEGERLTAISYDTGGRISEIIDPMGRATGFQYDLNNRVIRQTLTGIRDAELEYDLDGNLTALAPPGRPQHEFSYSRVGLQERYSPPDLGDENQATTYTFDRDRRLTQMMRPGGESLDLGYDTAGRLSTANLPGRNLAYLYDQLSGRVTTLVAPEVSLEYAYDGFLLLDSTWAGEVSGRVTRVYDSNFRVASRTINGGSSVAFEYDRDGLQTKSGNLTITRDPQNALLRSTAIGEVSSVITYNEFGEPTELTAQFAESVLYAAAFERNKLGRIVQKLETIGGVTTSYEYEYAQAGWLKRVKKDDLLVSEYAYDLNGNRLSYAGLEGSVDAIYDAQDRLLRYGDVDYEYTANGELAAKRQGEQSTTFQYDLLGNLGRVLMPDGLEIEYVVGPRNRRLGKKVNGQLVQGFLYKDRLNPIAEIDGTGGLVSRFVYGTLPYTPDYLEKNGKTYRIIADYQGSVRLVVDIVSGEVVQRLDYDEFGRITLDTNPGFQPFGYTGGLYDSHTRLLRLGARDYDPEIGRWIAKDRSRFIDGYNLYSYCRQDPINFIDPDGREAATVLGTIWGSVAPRLPLAGSLAAGDGFFPIGEIVGAAIIIAAVIEGVDAFYSEDTRDDPYVNDPSDVAPVDGEDCEEDLLEQLTEPPNSKDVERRRQRHRDQRESRDPQELQEKIEEILRDYPDQGVGRTRQDLENLLKDLKESSGEQ